MADDPELRIAVLTLCDEAGNLLGTTREFRVPSEYWSDVEPLVTAAHAQLGIDVTVLRLLHVERGVHGAPDRTSYLAQVAGRAHGLIRPTALDRRVLEPQPFRMPWAIPGGPDAQLAWAHETLAARGIHPTAPAVQARTWNLSSLWRLPTTAGTVWLKAVPPFFAHEGAVIERLAGRAVPQLFGRADGVCLMADVAGSDLYRPSDEAALAMIDELLAIQRDPRADVGELLASGVQDWRLSTMPGPCAHALEQRGDELAPQERRAVEALIAELDERGARLEECGIRDSLVHGDFHPGNVRGSQDGLTILDWGDSAVGHPLLDVAAFTERMPAAQRTLVEGHWVNRWRAAIPGSDPERAMHLIAPIGALRQAAIYRVFLDHIEPDERVYHERDDLIWLRRTAALVSSGRT